ncbi:DeoR/GlpR family DNA-binding transcription regulator [Pseudolactococcus yaeyamensis]
MTEQAAHKSESTRKRTLLKLLQEHKKLTNEKMSELLFCSQATLRRELIDLEKEGHIRRIRGGAVLEVAQNHEISVDYRYHINAKMKEHIAEIASTFIGSGMSLFLDSSGTVSKIMPYLATVSNLVIVTNGLKTAYDLIQIKTNDSKVFFLGGEVIYDAASTVGNYGNDFLDAINIDLALLSTTGLDENGAYEANFEQMMLKRRILEKSKASILMVDSTKFDKLEPYKLSSLSPFESVITDTISEEQLTRLQDVGVELLY